MGHRWAHRRTACTHGHPYPENLAYDREGHAFCRACRRAWNRTYNRIHQSRLPVEPDPVAVTRTLNGDRPARLTAAERAAAVLALTRRGHTAEQIAEMAGCTPRTVYRIRSRTAA
ncbi:helix-turn-helix domain-containing protein [Streptomyces sp. NPDC012888]|uniref:helix-turn-helix domain-containing protein n=1 Tax=Streptomyces sp. NPDC012888 TaxID=3364855 RepID=UPI0036810D43